MSNLYGLCELNLPWSAEYLGYIRTTVKSQSFWGQLQNIIDTVHVASLDKIRGSESTTWNPKPKRPHSRSWAYQCRCWFTLVSGYDWRSLGGEGKITWTVIANNFGVEKQKKFCTEQWFFLVNFRTVATYIFWKILRKFVLIVWIQEKKAQQMEILVKVYKPQNFKKKRKKKIHWYRGVYVCTLDKLWKKMLWTRVQGPGTNEFKQSYWLKALNWFQGL
jgi:hypothetical protein